MKRPTFREQFEKIVGAYLHDELNPWSGCGCFIGNLLNRETAWQGIRKNTGLGREAGFSLCNPSDYKSIGKQYFEIAIACVAKEGCGLYTPQQIIDMENNFLYAHGQLKDNTKWMNKFERVENEKRTFAAMESTLLMLKKIHEDSGEMVEDYSFTKRELQTT